MSDTYFLNGTLQSVQVSLNTGAEQAMQPLDFLNPTREQTAVFGLASSPSPGVLGVGKNEVRVTVGSNVTIWDVELQLGVVNIALDVQIIVFANQLQAKNTTHTSGFTITKRSSAAVEATPPPMKAGAASRRPPAVQAETAEVNFTLLQSDAKGALYEADNNPTAGANVALTDYYLFADGTPPQTLTLQESWDKAGAYVFLDDQVEPSTLLQELDQALSQEGTSFSRLAWRLAADHYQIVQSSSASAVSESVNLDIGTWRLSLIRNATLSLDSASPGILIAKAANENNILVQVVSDGIPQTQGTIPDQVLIPLAGDHRGSLTLAWDWEHYELGQDFGGNLRLFYGQDAESASMVQYPLFTPAPDPGRFPEKDLFFNIYMQPLATLDGNRTRLALDLSQNNKLSSHYLSSTTNAPVTLTPAVPSNGDLTAGFGFAKNTGQQESDRYMCPVGEFEVTENGGASADSGKRVQIRGGIAGTEYVLAEPGDRLSFENARPAFAPGYNPDAPAPGTLDETLTTSWVRVIRQSQAAATGSETVNTSYCAQASASTYFGSELDPAYKYPIAVGASLVRFTPASEEDAFPMLPYGGVFFQDEAEGIPNPNPDLSAGNLGQIEQMIVAPDRRSQLEPFFNIQFGPIFFDTSTNLAFDGGFARTPLGLLAGLNRTNGGAPPSGTIQRIILARSPQNPDQFLELTADSNGVVNPQFFNTVLDDNLFLVATDPNSLAPFSNEIQLGDFTFEVNLGEKDNEAIAIFKFVPGVTARQLINDTDAWTLLIGEKTAAKIKAISDRLQEYLAIADQGGELFADFRHMIDDPNWNGILIFNCPLDYQALPLDIQILLGGIKGQLLAHHFGITINRLGENQSELSIDHSSLFSVIHYQEDFVPPSSFPDFQVLLLNVRYANSKLAVFDSQIAFSIKDLFGNPVTLAVAPPDDIKQYGTIVIDGVYTLNQDGTGSLVFSTQDKRSYAYDADDGVLRVMVAQSVGDASLVPVESQDDSGATIAVSSFNLAGLLAFQPDIGGDLFSYGKVDSDVPVQGLAIIDYAFGMRTRIEGNDAELLGIETDLAQMKVDQALSQARDESLEQTFPGLIQQVTIAPLGLRPVDDGDWQVKVGGSDFEAAPVYSQTFDVPLGILGALLSTKTDLTAQLFVGWVPGGAASASDEVGVILRLPSEVAGPGGFQFEGVISSSFEYVQLDRYTLSSSTGGDGLKLYALRFVHYQGYLLNLFFSYDSAPKDLGFFGGPGNPGGSNSLFFVGKTADSNWNGPSVSVVLDGVPSIFLGRSYEIKTDPTNPNVIDEVFDKLNPLTDKTVEEFINLIFANASLYNSDAGIAFAIKFSFKSLALTAVLHDSSFYGGQIKLTPEKKENGNGGNGKNGENGDNGSGGDTHAQDEALALREAESLILAEEENGKDDGFLSKIQDFTFTIIYRKVSDEVGVWSADIYLNLGQLTVGAYSLTLPNFSISIWTNGDWRFAIGWPFEGDSAHPITVQFQAGPVPVIAKAGFYLAKLSSAAAPDQFGTEFNLIWSFGAGLAAGVGKEFKQGPLQAGASLILGLTFEGFLASFSGKMTEDGVDYWWWGIGLSLTGNVFGKVDFKVIAVEVSLTIRIAIGLAIETAHKTLVKATAEVKAKASVKILFVKISFSFKVTLDLFTATFGSGPVAKLSGPTPTAVLDTAPASIRARQLDPVLLRQLRRQAPAEEHRGRYDRPFERMVTSEAEAVGIKVAFVLQPTSISSDGQTWAPQGVASLVMTSDGESSPFGLLAAGLAEWLIAAYGGDGGFRQQLDQTEAALQAGAFDSQVEEALAATFIFNIASAQLEAETGVVGLAMHPSLGVLYPPSGEALRLHDKRLPSNFLQMIEAYFGGGSFAEALENGEDSAAAMVFNEYFVMLAQQLISLLIETNADNLQTALDALDLGDLGGFVSRFLLGGQRLPDPDDPNRLEALYILTGQQFPLMKQDDQYVLTADLQASGSTPSWIKVADGTSSSLDANMVYTSGPSAPPWTLGQLRALEPASLIFPMNNNNNWTDGQGTSHVITTFSDDVDQAVQRWRSRTGSTSGPWLVQELLGGESDSDQQVNLEAGGTPWKATSSLMLPLRLAAIPDPSGEPGAILADVFSLLGTDEANRALLQNLLDASNVSNLAVDLLASPSRGNWTSTKTPRVLVRTDLSTSSQPPGAVALEGVEQANADDGDNCSNYAKPGQGGNQLLRFLRLVWEVSIVHNTGFFLQVEDLDLSMFDDGPADLMLLVRFGSQASTLEVSDYQNALAGPPLEDGKAIFSTLAGDASGTPVQAFSAAYPGGEVGWSATWNNAPDEADAGSQDFLQGLYQMVSYRVEKVNGQDISGNWSLPISAQDESPAAASSTTWNYQRTFETAPLVGADNRYAAIDDDFTVRISIQDIFGNRLPDSLLPTVDLKAVYNDDILGLGDWAGTQVYYLVADPGSGVQMQLHLSLEASVVQDSDGSVDPEQLVRATLLYQQIKDQLTDPNMSASLSTGEVLAASPLTKLISGGSLASGLSGYIDSVVKWLENGGTGEVPDPVTLALALDKSYPSSWKGDLQELAVALLLERADVPDEIAEKSPEVRRVSSPVQPIEETKDESEDDPSGLTTFADGLEKAYFPFDGNKGVIKVATGLNSDPGSRLFGRRNIWLQRWSEEAGTSVQILNDDEHKPTFYAPPPLSTQLITRQVAGLRNYTTPDEYTEINRIFSSADMDRWAALFLDTVETIFSPQMAPSVADHSSAQDELYDPFVGSKESLAGSISQSIDYIYDEPVGTGDPASAQETWRQALLRTLKNDYGFSTLTQLEALVKLHGEIEPGGDPNNPPQLYGAVQVPGTSSEDKLPYSLTPTTLPLVDGSNWLNFLTSAQDPAAQRAFTLNLDYEVNQLEHLRDGSASACGYTPSSWLTFVLQQNPASLPQGQDNTLTQPIGTTRIPIPLRTYPPLPKLLQTSAQRQNEEISEISEALSWLYALTVERSGADQDSVNLSLTFNVPVEPEAPETARAMMASGREAPSDLFAALGRFVYEYPQLEDYINALPEGGGQESVQAVKEFSDIIAGVAATWPEWTPTLINKATLALASASTESDHEVWNFELVDVENSADLQVTATWTRGGGAPPWPQIAGYQKTSEDGNTATYTPDGGQRLRRLEMSWSNLYILDYQNVLPSAYTERNRNLAPPGEETNSAFIYRTETVSWATPIVPLISVPEQIELSSDSSLQAAVLAMLQQLTAVPQGSVSNDINPEVEFETSIDYRYEVMAHKNSSVFSLLPVFLLDATTEKGQEAPTAQEIADNLATWRNNTQAESKQSSLRFQLSLFATAIVSDNERLPLVQFPGLVIPVPDDSGWWS